MYQRNLMICLLSTLFWLMVTAEPKNASAQTPGTPSKTETKATNQSPKRKTKVHPTIKPPEDVRAPKGEMDEAKGLLWLGIQIIGLLAVLLIGLLIWLIGRSWSINNLKNALDDRPTRLQLQEALAALPTRLQLQEALAALPTRLQLEALADRPTRQQLQEALAALPTRQQLQEALAALPTRQQLEALADRPSRPQLQDDLLQALAALLKRQQLQDDIKFALKHLQGSGT